MNVEAGLEIDARLTDRVILDALDALASWKDEEGGLARRLDAEFLQQLVDNGYVPDERAVRNNMASERQPSVIISSKEIQLRMKNPG